MATCCKVMQLRGDTRLPHTTRTPVAKRKRSRRPQRLQRTNAKGTTLQDLSPDGAWVISVDRRTDYGNPFRVGGFFMLGDPQRVKGWPRMHWCEANPKYVDERFTFITTAAQALAWYEALLKRHPLTPGMIATLRGYHLACYCPIGEPCHADTLLRLVNRRKHAKRRTARRPKNHPQGRQPSTRGRARPRPAV